METTMELLPRLILIDAIIVSLTDAIVFYHLKQHPENLTMQFVIMVIIITIIPIAINLWYWLRKRKPG
jgi:heme/copper-type cytochrome/quinol oxidase subunit 4